MLLGCQKL